VPFPRVYSARSLAANSVATLSSPEDDSHLSEPAKEAVKSSIAIPGNPILRKDDDVHTFLRRDLEVDRLNKMHKHLWWAGLPYNTRALHEQRILQRGVVRSEKPWLHLLWYEGTIFIKPLPAYLLSVEFFRDHIKEDATLRPLALGFLRSYSKLIQSPLDLQIAQDEQLVPKDLEWDHWAQLAPHFIYLEDTEVNKRYIYGELRLARVNQAHRFCVGFPDNYYSLYVTYQQFFYHNFAWLLLPAYISIVLAALQLLITTNPEVVPLSRTNLEKSSWWVGMLTMWVLCLLLGVLAFVAIGSFAHCCWCTIRNLKRLRIDWVGSRRKVSEPEKAGSRWC